MHRAADGVGSKAEARGGRDSVGQDDGGVVRGAEGVLLRVVGGRGWAGSSPATYDFVGWSVGWVGVLRWLPRRTAAGEASCSRGGGSATYLGALLWPLSRPWSGASDSS